MRYINTVVLFLAFLLGLMSCSPLKEFEEQSTSKCELNYRAPLSEGYSTVLYKASVDIMGKHLSGVMFFKNSPADSSKRVVFLSEFGLNFLDLQYKKGEVTVKNVQEFMNKPQFIEILKTDMGFLVSEITPIENTKCYRHKTQNINEYRFKSNSFKYVVQTDSINQITEIQRLGGWGKGIQTTLQRKDSRIPEKIDYHHNGINLTISLKLLKIEP